MNISTLNIPKEEALKALRQYKENRGVYDRLDQEIERIYRSISRGNKVISINTAIRNAGFDDKGNPKLAIGRADAKRVRCQISRNALHFDNPEWRGGRWKIVVPFSGERPWRNIVALVPRIPPQHRPKRLDRYHILWEADWTEIPRDPYLLKRIGKDAWVVLAAWDLTEVEVSVLRAHQTN